MNIAPELSTSRSGVEPASPRRLQSEDAGLPPSAKPLDVAGFWSAVNSINLRGPAQSSHGSRAGIEDAELPERPETAAHGQAAGSAAKPDTINTEVSDQRQRLLDLNTALQNLTIADAQAHETVLSPALREFHPKRKPQFDERERAFLAVGLLQALRRTRTPLGKKYAPAVKQHIITRYIHGMPVKRPDHQRALDVLLTARAEQRLPCTGAETAALREAAHTAFTYSQHADVTPQRRHARFLREALAGAGSRDLHDLHDACMTFLTRERPAPSELASDQRELLPSIIEPETANALGLTRTDVKRLAQRYLTDLQQLDTREASLGEEQRKLIEPLIKFAFEGAFNAAELRIVRGALLRAAHSESGTITDAEGRLPLLTAMASRQMILRFGIVSSDWRELTPVLMRGLHEAECLGEWPEAMDVRARLIDGILSTSLAIAPNCDEKTLDNFHMQFRKFITSDAAPLQQRKDLLEFAHLMNLVDVNIIRTIDLVESAEKANIPLDMSRQSYPRLAQRLSKMQRFWPREDRTAHRKFEIFQQMLKGQRGVTEIPQPGELDAELQASLALGILPDGMGAMTVSQSKVDLARGMLEQSLKNADVSNYLKGMTHLELARITVSAEGTDERRQRVLHHLDCMAPLTNAPEPLFNAALLYLSPQLNLDFREAENLTRLRMVLERSNGFDRLLPTSLAKAIPRLLESFEHVSQSPRQRRRLEPALTLMSGAIRKQIAKAFTQKVLTPDAMHVLAVIAGAP